MTLIVVRIMFQKFPKDQQPPVMLATVVKSLGHEKVSWAAGGNVSEGFSQEALCFLEVTCEIGLPCPSNESTFKKGTELIIHRVQCVSLFIEFKSAPRILLQFDAYAVHKNRSRADDGGQLLCLPR